MAGGHRTLDATRPLAAIALLLIAVLLLPACSQRPGPVKVAPKRERSAEPTETIATEEAEETTEAVYPGGPNGTGMTLLDKQKEVTDAGFRETTPEGVRKLIGVWRAPDPGLGAKLLYVAAVAQSRGGEAWAFYDNGMVLRIQRVVTTQPWPFQSPSVPAKGQTYEPLPVTSQPTFYQLQVDGVEARGLQRTTMEAKDGTVQVPCILSWVKDGTEYSLSGIDVRLEQLVIAAQSMK